MHINGATVVLLTTGYFDLVYVTKVVLKFQEPWFSRRARSGNLLIVTVEQPNCHTASTNNLPGSYLLAFFFDSPTFLIFDYFHLQVGNNSLVYLARKKTGSPSLGGISSLFLTSEIQLLLSTLRILMCFAPSEITPKNSPFAALELCVIWETHQCCFLFWLF